MEAAIGQLLCSRLLRPDSTQCEALPLKEFKVARGSQLLLQVFTQPRVVVFLWFITTSGVKETASCGWSSLARSLWAELRLTLRCEAG
eukprot:4400362-Amphidinium_carterae.2